MPPYLLDLVSIFAFFQRKVHLRLVGRKRQMFKAVRRMKRNSLIQMIDPHGAKLFEMFPLLLVHRICSFSVL